MDADPGDVIATSFHFTGVHTDAHFHAELARAVTDGEPTLNRPGRTVEGGQKAITGGLDVAASEAMNLTPSHTVVVIEQLAPATVAGASRPLR